jgi:hypothetical protein
MTSNTYKLHVSHTLFMFHKYKHVAIWLFIFKDGYNLSMQTSDIILHSNVVPQFWDELLALDNNGEWHLKLIQKTEMSTWSCIGQ